jgi:hypothetical protein
VIPGTYKVTCDWAPSERALDRSPEAPVLAGTPESPDLPQPTNDDPRAINARAERNKRRMEEASRDN